MKISLLIQFLGCLDPCSECAGSAKTCTACENPNPFLYYKDCYPTCPSRTFANSSQTCDSTKIIIRFFV